MCRSVSRKSSLYYGLTVGRFGLIEQQSFYNFRLMAKTSMAATKRTVFIVEDHPVFARRSRCSPPNQIDGGRFCGGCGIGPARNWQIATDLVLVDIGLPGKSGLNS